MRAEHRPAPIRVLVIEDEPSLREALGDALGAEPGVELAGTAPDGVEGARLAEGLRPDVALVDVKMPGGGGAEATKEIRRRSPATQVVALSAYEDRASVLQMLRAGAVGYLVKGVSVAEIVQAIRRAVRGYGSLSAEVTGGVVHELAGHLERVGEETDRLKERRRRVERVLSGEGLDIVFQPIADLSSRRVVGLEALARFPAPPSRPDLWFEEAETVGLRTDLEVAALLAATGRLRSLPADAYLSVNLSPETAMSLAGREALASVPPDRLVLEITEHARVDDYKALGAALRPLRSRGARLAVDDAGAGFASLSHILRLAPDIIKLDITLTRDIDSDNARRALASGLIAFAIDIGASILAEGIETAEELQTLRTLGVTLGQGYFLGRPVPLPETGLTEATL
ncbi:MAG: EAL domain-containing protein [Actinomycetota bacterium]